jgi:plastocyanin
MQFKHSRMFTYVATAATVAITAAMIAVGAPSASAAPRQIDVTAGYTAGFSPKTINVTAGEQVSICLKVTDMPHDLTIASPAFKVAATTKGTAVCKTLTAPASGSHPFKCSIIGHESMTGTLVVGGAAAAPAAAPAAGAAPQVAAVPAGGVQTGGGSTAGVTHTNLLMLGAGLLLAAMMSVLFGTRVARRD